MSMKYDPLTDEEVGSVGNRTGWDGERGPVLSTRSGQEYVEYKKFNYVDYTLNALNNKFDYSKLIDIDTKEYLDRVMRYNVAQAEINGNKILLSFTKSNNEFIFRFLLSYRVDRETRDKVRLRITNSRTIRIDNNNNVV